MMREDAPAGSVPDAAPAAPSLLPPALRRDRPASPLLDRSASTSRKLLGGSLLISKNLA